MTNEAEERLRKAYKHDGRVGPWLDEALDVRSAEERRNLIADIRERYRKSDSYRLDEHGDNLDRILDDLSTPEQE